MHQGPCLAQLTAYWEAHAQKITQTARTCGRQPSHMTRLLPEEGPSISSLRMEACLSGASDMQPPVTCAGPGPTGLQTQGCSTLRPGAPLCPSLHCLKGGAASWDPVLMEGSGACPASQSRSSPGAHTGSPGPERQTSEDQVRCLLLPPGPPCRPRVRIRRCVGPHSGVTLKDTDHQPPVCTLPRIVPGL